MNQAQTQEEARRRIEATRYEMHGYKDRQQYLEDLYGEYGQDVVDALASILGAEEDFDGLVSALQDYEGMM